MIDIVQVFNKQRWWWTLKWVQESQEFWVNELDVIFQVNDLISK